MQDLGFARDLVVDAGVRNKESDRLVWRLNTHSAATPSAGRSDTRATQSELKGSCWTDTFFMTHFLTYMAQNIFPFILKNE